MDFGMIEKMEYPGRGIVMGRSSGGNHAITAYFIMGRSENSRNRCFLKTEDGIRTEAVDVTKMSDPSLVIYRPVRRCGSDTIITNGDQTDTIVEMLQRGGTFADALRTRTFEPDAPHFTPRISGMLTPSEGGLSYQLAIVKSAAGNPASVERFFYEYPQPLCGQGHFIHTYGDLQGSEVLPSFVGEPLSLSLPDLPLTAFADLLWGSLNSGNRISLYVAFTHLATGTTTTRLINRFPGESQEPPSPHR